MQKLSPTEIKLIIFCINSITQTDYPIIRPLAPLGFPMNHGNVSTNARYLAKARRSVPVYEKCKNFISMWTTVTETLVCLCSFVVLCPFVRAPLPNRDERSSVATIETVLDRVNIALCGIQRNMRTQPSRDAMLDMQREIRAVLRNVGRMRHLYTGENVATTMQVLQVLQSSVVEK